MECSDYVKSARPTNTKACNFFKIFVHKHSQAFKATDINVLVRRWRSNDAAGHIAYGGVQDPTKVGILLSVQRNRTRK